MATTNILATLSQVQSITTDLASKVAAKGYAKSADLGSLASKNEVAKSDLASALSTEISNATSNISTQTGRINTLVGSDTDKSVRTIANEELAAQLIPQDAQEALDTLEEIAAWIQEHPQDAAAMAAKLTLGTHEVDGVQVQYNTVKAYVEAYVASQLSASALSEGNGIDIDNGVVSVNIDTTNANGLDVTANGLKMGLASTSAAGAMSSSDKSKLDNADVTAYTEGNGVEINNHVVSAKVNAGNGLSLDATNGITMAAVSASTDGVGGSAGAMTAADKEKLDGFRIATSAEVTAVINAINISD